MSLSPQARAILQASQARRIRAARLAHYQQLARIAQAPDYFEHTARSGGLPRSAQTFTVRSPEMLAAIARAPAMRAVRARLDAIHFPPAPSLK